MERYEVESVYRCNFCNKTYGDIGGVEEHLKECLLNYIDKGSCVTCKNACLVLESPFAKDNGYNRLSLLEVLGNKNWLECDKGIYEGQITQEKIFREFKSCYEPVEGYSDSFIIKKTEAYNKYKAKIDDSIKEQEEIDNDIKEFWEEVKRLDEEGYNEEEIGKILEEKYKDE